MVGLGIYGLGELDECWVSSTPQPVTPISSQEEQDKLLDIALIQVKHHGFNEN